MSEFAFDPDTLAMIMGVLTLFGSAITYFVQRNQEKRQSIVQRDQEKRQEAKEELDRQLALERVRKQLTHFVGPLHRLFKTHTTVTINYFKNSGHGMDHMLTSMKLKGCNYWIHLFKEDFLLPFIDNPNSSEAKHYRNLVARRLKPLYTRIRELVLVHGSDLADLPSQEEWLEMYDQASVTSPILGSLNTNVIFDTFSAWTLEFDDIIESWAEEDYERMQPTIVVNWCVLNELVDLLFDNAKEKEAKYNKHVKLHKNVVDKSMEEQLARSGFIQKPSKEDV